ncbi:exopolysaccharide production protein YjbE [Methylobacterium sp. P1-11]|uniref:exopolysaccharide production protein YjbE n=1 Tax=Methylobacterium sp. P1-11 TaxID=2024616 RepID=UPI0011EBCB61|nr:exopolysaccharide production protein YjbE [Methylobacterium sp. P1-11]KAA0123573.1 exopolysaccharide production protein YjbE [Methylobacterium sp. P1-11]
MKVSRLAGAIALLALAAGPAFAAPCSTGTTKSKTPDQQASNPQSSDVDKSSKNLAGGNQPASPGTVGAMNNAGATQTADRQAQTDAGSKSKSTDPAAANLAGGNQPASPGTVGAMNKAAADRQTAPVSGDDC